MSTILRRVLWLALGARVVLQVIGHLSSPASVGQEAIDMWIHWDASNFMRVAQVGYPGSGNDALFIVYLPFYPAAVRLLAFVVRSPGLSALVVSFAATVGAAWFLYRLVSLDDPPRDGGSGGRSERGAEVHSATGPAHGNEARSERAPRDGGSGGRSERSAAVHNVTEPPDGNEARSERAPRDNGGSGGRSERSAAVHNVTEPPDGNEARSERAPRDDDEAWRALILLFAFPTAYFLFAPYSESLYLLGVVASVYAARTGRWMWAGLAGALATGTRVVGLALVPALGAEALRERKGAARRLAWVAVVPAGFAVYLLINLYVHGDALAFVDTQRGHWNQWAVPPWNPVREAFVSLTQPHLTGEPAIIYRGRLAAFVFAAGLLLIGVRRLRVTDQVYGWAGLVIVLSMSWLISLPRYLLGLYPLVWVLASSLRRRIVFWPVVALGMGAQAYFFWRYARGWWTF